MNFVYWQLFDCVRWSYFNPFEIFFSGLAFTELLMRWGLFLWTWLALIFCEANWVTVLSWHFDKTLAYFSMSLHWVLPQWYDHKIPLYCILGSYYPRSKASVPNTNKIVIWSRIRFYEVLLFFKTRDYVTVTCQLKAFQNGWSDVFAILIRQSFF